MGGFYWYNASTLHEFTIHGRNTLQRNTSNSDRDQIGKPNCLLSRWLCYETWETTSHQHREFLRRFINISSIVFATACGEIQENSVLSSL